MKIDMHVHSKYSFDGRMDFETLFAAASARGLSGVAVCDHDNLEGARQAERWRRAHPAYRDFIVVPGCEYSTERGHMLAYFISTGAEEADLPRTADGRFLLRALSDFVHRQGGLLIAAHPLRHRTALPDGVLPCIDGAETHNARQIAYDGLVFGPVWDGLLASGITTGGSDAHGKRELARAYTVFKGTTLADIEQELRAGQAVAQGKATSLTLQALYKLRRHGSGSLFRRLARVPVFMLRDLRRLCRKR